MIIIFRQQLYFVNPKSRDLVKGENLNIIDSDTIRQFLQESESELAIEINEYLNSGTIMPQELIIKSVMACWKKDHKNVIINFPKNEKQLIQLLEAAEKLNDPIEKLIYYPCEAEKLFNDATRECPKHYDQDTKPMVMKMIRTNLNYQNSMLGAFEKLNCEIIEAKSWNEKRLLTQ